MRKPSAKRSSRVNEQRQRSAKPKLQPKDKLLWQNEASLSRLPQLLLEHLHPHRFLPEGHGLTRLDQMWSATRHGNGGRANGIKRYTVMAESNGNLGSVDMPQIGRSFYWYKAAFGVSLVQLLSCGCEGRRSSRAKSFAASLAAPCSRVIAHLPPAPCIIVSLTSKAARGKSSLIASLTAVVFIAVGIEEKQRNLMT